MKVEVNLTVVKDEAVSDTNHRRTPRAGKESSSPEVVLLISQENQQARRLDPTSLTEAQNLLLEVTRHLAGAPGETLAEVHLLESQCLVRLP